MAAPKIKTYHCLCTSLLIASTHSLLSLPRRAPPSLDSAIIVPLQSPPDPPQPASDLPQHATAKDKKDDPAGQPNDLGLGYTLLLGTARDARPSIIRRSDGFEKRHLLRCERCRLVVGYELDESHFSSPESATIDVDMNRDVDMNWHVDADEGEEAPEKQRVRTRTRIVYILPGGVMGTEAMAAGKKVSEQDVTLGEGEQRTVAAWE